MGNKREFDLEQFVQGQLARDASLRHDLSRLTTSQSAELQAELGHISRFQALEDLANDVNRVFEEYDATSSLRLVFNDPTTGTLPIDDCHKPVTIYHSKDLAGRIVSHNEQQAAIIGLKQTAHLYTMGRERKTYEPIFALIGTIVGDALNYQRALQQRDQAARERDMATHLAHTDQLTELPNRHYWENVVLPRLDQEVKTALTEQRSPLFALVMTDIDHFKDYNDKFGHDIGDIALQATANSLRSSSRSGNDSRPKDEVVIRVGGEEKLVVYFDIGRDHVYAVADRARQKVTADTQQGIETPKGRTPPITLSEGAVHSSDFDVEMKVLYSREGRDYLAQFVTASPPQKEFLRQDYTGTPKQFQRMVELAEAVPHAYKRLSSRLKREYTTPEAFLRNCDSAPIRILTETMKGKADAALYQAKHKGRNRLVMYQRAV
ncbi:GGDEF domain-containing protein [Candidatus Woesearchaeota archaeon]|nr:GGDEF domain-containing protein [Candidatus Woesearchaeota archaeon]